MTNSPSIEERARDLTMTVFTISASMVGVCLTAIGILRLIISQTQVQTIGDDILAGDAVIFMLCSFICFWSFKTRSASMRRALQFTVDGMFMLGLMIMVGACGVIAYAVA